MQISVNNATAMLLHTNSTLPRQPSGLPALQYNKIMVD